jgi:hypothetical protein
MDTKTIDFYVVVELFFLLLIGLGPKIALVPFLDVTAGMARHKGVGESGHGNRAAKVAPSQHHAVAVLVDLLHAVVPGGLDDSRREPRLHAIRTMHLRQPRT